MVRANQETVTTFGEVLHSANISYSQNSKCLKTWRSDSHYSS